jgi:hypothetical protein
MGNQILGRSNGCNGQKKTFFEESHQALAHTFNHFFKSFE